MRHHPTNAVSPGMTVAWPTLIVNGKATRWSRPTRVARVVHTVDRHGWRIAYLYPEGRLRPVTLTGHLLRAGVYVHPEEAAS